MQMRSCHAEGRPDGRSTINVTLKVHHATLATMSTFVLHGGPSGRLNKIDYAKELNQEQLDVVLHGDGPCLVLAGAGSGKTRTLTYRVGYMLEQGVDPSSILLLTFTNKAAREMLQRVGSLIGPAANGIWGGTFHSIGARLLRGFADRLGYTSSFSILDNEDANDLVKAVMKDLKIDPKARRFPSASVVHDVISYARNVQMNIQDVLEIKYPNFYPFAGEIEGIMAQYHERKKAANVMDFDDLLSNLLLILENPVWNQAITARFQYVLVDEFQDTNAIQARIVKGFGWTHKNVLVVGDDAQSIYAFRGADVKNILSFPEQWPNARIFKLLTNYRSTPQILELANESLEHNQHQFKKDLIASVSSGDKPKLTPCASAAQEAQYVAEQILDLRSKGTALNNIAVLFRSSAHSQALEFELMKRDIPYEYRGGQKFFERAHIKDVVAFLRMYANPVDEIAWMRVLGLQTGIGAATATAITDQVKAFLSNGTTQEAHPFSLLLDSQQSLAIPSRGKGGWDEFVRIAKDIHARAPLPSAMIRGVVDSSYEDYLEREYPNWKDRLEDLEQLAIFAEGYDDLDRFLADISLYDEVVSGREQASNGNDKERMVLSTIHQAKGLEWDTVFIIHLTDQAFPSKRALSEQSGIEEERRLFYVAVTRARKKLFLTYPMTFGYDTLIFGQPSTFLEEVSPRLFDRVELRSAGMSNAVSYNSRKTEADWSWDEAGYSSDDEPAIQIDADGERRQIAGNAKASVWKSDPNKKKGQIPTSFLRDVDEL